MRYDYTSRDGYIESKKTWTTYVSFNYLQRMRTDWCIAEAGAAGPTFRPSDLHEGFTVIAIGRGPVPSGALDCHC